MESTFLFRADRVDITPSKPIPLAGYALRRVPYSKIIDNLEADAVIISDSKQRIVIVSTDLLYVGRTLRNLILEKVRGVIEEDELLITASHTHFAPATDETKPRLGTVNPEYVQRVADKISQLIRRLAQGEIERASICFSKGLSSAPTMNRMRHGLVRLIPPKRAILPNPGGFKDPFIRTFKIIDSGGKTRAVMWDFGCHPVGSDNRNSVSADFPGHVRGVIRKWVGSAIPVLFWQGFSGDVRPISQMNAEPQENLRFRDFSEPEWKDWVESLGRSVVETLGQECKVELIPLIRRRKSAIPLSELGLRGSDEPVAINSIDIGGAKLVTISGEPVAEYVPVLENLFPESKVVPIGCAGHVFGYLPTAEMLGENEYEITGFQKYFGLKGNFAPDVQKKVEETLRSI